MTITITSLRLRSLWLFFKLSWYGLKITRQAKKSKGFVKMKNTGLGYLHYTITAWESEEDMKQFMQSGAHAAAMQKSASIATEICVFTYTANSLPSWKQAKEKLKQGKVHQF